MLASANYHYYAYLLTGKPMKKVLLVSSSKSFLQRSKNLLKNRGVEILTSSSGPEALKLHTELGFDLIISDLKLEGMDGCYFCSQVHMEHSSQPVPVILICDDDINCLAKVKQSEAIAILIRPIRHLHLLNTIDSFLEVQLVRDDRVEFKTRVSCKTKNHEFVCDSHDISVSGIILETEQQLELGGLVTCTFQLADSGRIQQEGEITRRFNLHNSKTLYGVKFRELPLTSLGVIEAFVAKTSAGVQKQRRPVEVSKYY